MAPGRFAALQRLSAHDLALLAALGFAGNVGYYLAMALAVPRAGAAVVALVIGCLPVVMAVLGNAGSRRLPVRRLAAPLALIAAGLLLANAAGLAEARAAGELRMVLIGLAPTLAALVLWSWYGLRNARAVGERPGLSAVEWTALTGVGTLLALAPVLVVGWAGGLSAVPAIAGRCWHSLAATIPGFRPLPLDRLVYVGIRDFEAGQAERVEAAGIVSVCGAAEHRVDFAAELARLLTEAPFARAVVHLDLDCLDTSIGHANDYAAPGGLSAEQLLASLRLVCAHSAPPRSRSPPLTRGSRAPSASARPESLRRGSWRRRQISQTLPHLRIGSTRNPIGDPT